jgi:hypothetical protein
MLNLEGPVSVNVVPTTAAEVASSGFTSVVGHQDTANVLTTLLGVEVPMNRVSVRLEAGDVLYVAQVTGGRLPEGCTTLPQGMSLGFFRLTL